MAAHKTPGMRRRRHIQGTAGANGTGGTMDIATMTGMLIQGFGVSLKLFMLTLFGAIPLGIPVALA